jgi:hypothetical protein
LNIGGNAHRPCPMAIVNWQIQYLLDEDLSKTNVNPLWVLVGDDFFPLSNYNNWPK